MSDKVFNMDDVREGILTVVGSLNVDRVWTLDTLPHPGQNFMEKYHPLHWGGKGGNEAVAASRFGAKVSLLSMVGDDPDGMRYIEHLKAEGIDSRSVLVCKGLSSGAAYIYVDRNGENMIVVDPGATSRINKEFLSEYLPGLLKKSGAVLLPLELPLDIALETLRLADEAKVHSVLNASPVHPDFPWGKYPVGTVIVNEHECRESFGMAPENLLSLPAAERKSVLGRRGVENLVVTQGAEPTIMLSAEETARVKVAAVTPVDTVGAGDTFAGVLAAQIAAGATDWSKMIETASMAATLSTLKVGAQSAMPYHKEVTHAMSHRETLNKELIP